MYGKFLLGGLEEKQQAKAPENWYVAFCKRAGGSGPAGEFKDEKYKAALGFLGWDVTPRQVNAAPVLALFLALIAVVPAAAYILISHFVTSAPPFMELPFLVVMYALPALLMVPFAVLWYFQTYILRAAEAEKMASITYIPEIVNYLVMSMKLSPNLERAVEFTAEHGRGKIAEDLKRVVWDVKVGTYKTTEEGLDAVAYKWGKYSEEFKHALMLIRSSVIEIDEAKRAAILDKAVTDTLEGIRDSMDKYAVKMRQPSIYLYYVGVLLPLMLIIMLPIGSMMAKIPLAQTWILVLLYDIGIPIGTVFFASSILKNRPPVYVPPKIPDNYPGLPKSGNIKIGGAEISAVFLALAVGAGVFAAFNYVVEPMMNPLPPAWDTAATQAYFPFFFWAGIIIAVCCAASVMLYGTAYSKRKVQKEVMEMEKEFQDSIYVIASRLGENRPMEEAVAYTSEFLGGTQVAKVYKRASENITNLGMTAEMAFFDPVYGALKDTPSDLIRGSIRIVIDSMALGVQQAARALVSLSLQLRDSQKVKEKIAGLLEEITSMMKSIAFLIAPLVLGITSALQKIIIGALRSVGATGASAGSASIPGGASINMPMVGFGDPEMLKSVPDALTFLLIIAVYVIEITLILVYFTSRIEEGDNDLTMKMNMAQSLPIATTLFFISAFFASKLSVVV